MTSAEAEKIKNKLKVILKINLFMMVQYNNHLLYTICIHINYLDLGDGAAEKTRTSTDFTPQRPQRCASTSSATTALICILCCKI